jgi:hypothetical protein
MQANDWVNVFKSEAGGLDNLVEHPTTKGQLPRAHTANVFRSNASFCSSVPQACRAERRRSRNLGFN